MSLPNDTLSRAIAGEVSIFAHIGDVILFVYDGIKGVFLIALIVVGMIFLVKLVATQPPVGRVILGLILGMTLFIVVVYLIAFELQIRALLVELLPNTSTPEASGTGAVSYE